MVGEYPPVMASETDMDLPAGFQNGFDKYSNFKPMGQGGRADGRGTFKIDDVV